MAKHSLPPGMEVGRHYDFGGPIETAGCRVGKGGLGWQITVKDGELVGQDMAGRLLFIGVPLGLTDAFEFPLTHNNCDNITEIDPPRKRDAA